MISSLMQPRRANCPQHHAAQLHNFPFLPPPIPAAKLMTTWAGNVIKWLPFIACSRCGQNPCGHRGKELDWLLSPLGAEHHAPGAELGGRQGQCPGAGCRGRLAGEWCSPDSTPGESQRALLTCRSAFLPTHFPRSADPSLIAGFYSQPLGRPAAPSTETASFPKGLFGAVEGRTVSCRPCFWQGFSSEAS